MSSYVGWVAQQIAKRLSRWVGENPAASTLIGAGLASPATRGFVARQIWLVTKELAWTNYRLAAGTVVNLGKTPPGQAIIATYRSPLVRTGGTLSRVGLAGAILATPIVIVDSQQKMMIEGTVDTFAQSASEDPGDAVMFSPEAWSPSSRGV